MVASDRKGSQLVVVLRCPEGPHRGFGETFEPFKRVHDGLRSWTITVCRVVEVVSRSKSVELSTSSEYIDLRLRALSYLLEHKLLSYLIEITSKSVGPTNF